MFKKSLTGLMTVCAVAGGFAAMESANATQSPKGIQETLNAEKNTTKDTSAAAKAAEANAKNTYDSSVTSESNAKTAYESSKAAETTANNTYKSSVTAEGKAKSTYDSSVTAESNAKNTYESSVTAESNAKNTYEASKKTKNDLKLYENAQAKTKNDLKLYENAQTKTASNFKPYQDAQVKTASNLQSYKDAQAKTATNLQSYQDAQAKTAADLKSYQDAPAKTAADLKSYQDAMSKTAYDLSTYQAAQAGSKAWGNWTTTHVVQDKSTDTSGFQALIPQFQALVQKEGKAIPADQVAAKTLDPTKLFLEADHNVRVWFLNEGAAYKNQLAYESTTDSSYNKGMIFNNVSCTFNCELGNGDNGVLDIGDYVDLGVQKGGSLLNFLIKADGANANTANGDIYSGNASLNSDKLQHLIAWQVGDFLMIGFEDLRYGGDKDYNDVMFAVDFGKGNLTNKPKKVPESESVTALLGITGAGIWLRRRKNQSKVSA